MDIITDCFTLTINRVEIGETRMSNKKINKLVTEESPADTAGNNNVPSSIWLNLDTKKLKGGKSRGSG